MTLENRELVLDKLRQAERALLNASVAATESEGERTGLQGETALLIGGLSQAVGSLADLIEA